MEKFFSFFISRLCHCNINKEQSRVGKLFAVGYMSFCVSLWCPLSSKIPINIFSSF